MTLRRWYGFLAHADEGRAPGAASHHRVGELEEGHRRADGRRHPDTLHVVPVGVDQEQFRPLPHIARVPGRLLTTASADVPLKGLSYLIEALAKIRTERERRAPRGDRPAAPQEAVPAQLERLGLTDAVEFVSGITDERVVELYAEAEIAVVPSLYEGFSLPAIEAMACGVPLVTTTGGALPEVVGPSGGCAMTVPRRRRRRARAPAGARRSATASSAPAWAKAAAAACSTGSRGARRPKAPPSSTSSSSRRTHDGASTACSRC